MRYYALSIDTEFVTGLAERGAGQAFSCTLKIESANLSRDIYMER